MELDEDFGADYGYFADIEEKLIKAASRIEVLQVSGCDPKKL